MNSFHNVFNAMAGQGWTMNAAAGDSGSYDNGSSLSVDYPASDPDIIASGGSELHLNSDGTYNYETTWNGGGGGCSSYWATPSWQSGLSTGCGSRAVPDISLNASNVTAQVLWWDGGALGKHQLALLGVGHQRSGTRIGRHLGRGELVSPVAGQRMW